MALWTSDVGRWDAVHKLRATDTITKTGTHRARIVTDDEGYFIIMYEQFNYQVIQITTRCGLDHYRCEYDDTQSREVLEMIRPHILAPDRISIHYRASVVDDLSLMSDDAPELSLFLTDEVTFFPDNFPEGGIPIVLSRESIIYFCHERFQDENDEGNEIFILEGIAKVSENVGAWIESILDPAPGDGCQQSVARAIYDRMSADEAALSIVILHYLGVRWTIM